MRAFTGIALVVAIVACTAARAQDSGGSNAPAYQDKPYLVLISIDGFGRGFQARFETPALDRVAAGGVRAEALVPVFPTLTFPNHYSIATGLYPANHGLVGNRFPGPDRSRYYSLRDRDAVEDGSWYGGEPVWVAAEKNGMVTAAYYFVGTEAAIQGIRPTYWRRFNAAVPGADRVDQVLDWLSLPGERRPHLVTLYFEHVDTAGHDHGVDSQLVAEAVRDVDGFIARLLDGVAGLPIANEVYFVIVSDHGLANVRRGATEFVLEEVVDLAGTTAVDHDTAVYLWFDEPDRARALAMSEAINEQWAHGQAVVPGGAPASWRVPRDSPFADVIVQADPGWLVRSRRGEPIRRGGKHGWSPDFRDMHGIFLASGPRLPEGLRIGALEAVDVYPLLLEILELPQVQPIDGDPGRLLPLLADPQD